MQLFIAQKKIYNAVILLRIYYHRKIQSAIIHGQYPVCVTINTHMNDDVFRSGGSLVVCDPRGATPINRQLENRPCFTGM